MFTRAELEKHISDSGKKHRHGEHHSLPTGLQKAKQFLADEYLHEIQTHSDQRYFYFCAKCFHTLQNWHKSRLEGIRSQPVMDVVVSNPANNAEHVKKTGVTCLLTEARKGESDQKRKLEQLLHSLEQHSSTLGITQVVDPSSIDTSPVVDTRFGQCPVGSFGLYQLSFTESNFTFTPDNLTVKEMELLKSLTVGVIEANKMEEKTREQASCEEWMRERKLRFTASNFGKISRRQRNHTKFVEDLLAQKTFSSAAVEHGKKYEPVALKEYEKHMRKMGKPVKVLKSGLFVSPKVPILGCSPDAKIIDLSCKDRFGLGEVKCPSSKFHVTPLEACDDPGFFMENKNGKPSLKRSHVYYDQVQGLMGLSGVPWCDFIVYTSKGLSVERIKFDQDHWNNL
ncbi:unnamed protein product, partial [Pocillopora meandrina]